MFCPNCGQENAPEDKFCIYCGSELIDNQSFLDESTTATVDVKQTLQLLWGGIQSGYKSLRHFFRNHPKVCIPVVVIVVCCAVFSIANATILSGKQAAKRYFQAIINDNSRGVYSCLDLPESDFVNASKFDDYFQTLGYQQAKVGNYQITELDTTADKGDDGITSAYQITYYLRGDSSTRSMYVELVSIPQLFGLINHYKVLSDYIVTGYRILVPAGSTVTLNGTELHDPITNGGSECYTIPSLFNTTYTITVKNPFGSATGSFVPARSGTDADIYNCEMLLYNDETVSAIYSQAQAQFISLLNAAVAQQTFPADIAKTANSDMQGDIATRFADLQSYCYDASSGTGYTSIQLSNITDNSYQGQTFSANSPMEYSCEFSFSYSYSRRYRNWDGNLEIVNGESSGSARMHYVYENGSWVLEAFDCYL